MNEEAIWHTHTPGGCPFPGDTLVEVRFANDPWDATPTFDRAKKFNWGKLPEGGEIASYRVLEATPRRPAETVNHPAHYGGDTTYEAIKVIEAWGLGFCLGNTVKYISRAGKKNDMLEDLKKAAWYLQREIAYLERSQ